MTPLTAEQKQEALKWGVVPEEETPQKPTTTTPAPTTPTPITVPVNPTDAQLQWEAMQHGQTGSAAPVGTKTTPETTTKPIDQPKTPEIDAATQIKELEDQAKKADDLLKNKNLPQHIAENVMQNQQDIIRERDAALAKAELLKSYTNSGEKIPDEIKALMSKELAFYLKTEDGKLQIDVVKAVEAGVSRETLQAAGYSAMDIAKINRYLKHEKTWEKVDKLTQKYYNQKQAEFEHNNVKLGDGSYISMKDYRELEQSAPEYARIALEQGYDGMIKKMNDDAGIVPPPSLEDIRSAQQEYFSKNGWDIEDKTDPDYGKRIMEATRDFSDKIGYTKSKEELDAEMWAERKAVAKESVMQIVPFEYLRSGRWEQLQTWEKIIYPVTDVAALIPIVGWAGKGIAGIAKGTSAAAKVASLGGKTAIDTALKQTITGLEKGSIELTAKRALIAGAEDAMVNVKGGVKEVVKNTLKALNRARHDVKLATKEVGQMKRNVDELQKLSKIAAKVEGTTGQKVYSAVSKVARVGETKAAKLVDVADTTISATMGGVGTLTVIANWNDLTPAQRVAGVYAAAASMGILAPAIRGVRDNIANVVDPFKIPLSALKARRTKAKQIINEIYSEGGGAAGGTTRLVIGGSASSEKAREAVASVGRQLHEGKDVARATYAGKEIEVKSTRFQKTVGGNVSFSATPMGDIFAEGTGAFGKKTKLESFLTGYNKKVPEGEKIEIKSRPYSVKNLETGEMETITTKADTTPGATISGKEGGLYASQAAYTKFAHQSAYGAKGGMDAILIIHDAGISELPESIAKKNMKEMEKAAIKRFDGTNNVGEIVEGFKPYKNFMELENVYTNGTHIDRTMNLRSKLAEKLKMKRGEYYTRDKIGRIELLQMYLDVGRAIPYTLKELYQLKGNALRNTLEDMAFGLDEKLKTLRTGDIGKTPRQLDMITKEEQMYDAFKKLDNAGDAGRLTPKEVFQGKLEVIERYRRVNLKPSSLARFERLNRQRTARIFLQKSDEMLSSQRTEREERESPEVRVPEAREYEREGYDESRTRRRDRVEESRPDIRTPEARESEREIRDERRLEADNRQPEREPSEREIREPVERDTRESVERDVRELTEREISEPTERELSEPPDRKPPRPPEPPPPTRRPPTEEPPPPEEPTLHREPLHTKIRPSPNQIRNATASWPQGMGWWVVYRGSDGNLYKWFSHGQRPPKGVRNVRQGEGEAQRGIQQPTGDLTQEFDFPLGVTHARIVNPKRTPGKTGAISFSSTHRTRLPGSRGRITPSSIKKTLR